MRDLKGRLLWCIGLLVISLTGITVQADGNTLCNPIRYTAVQSDKTGSARATETGRGEEGILYPGYGKCK